jgi:Flp pilus assembly protein TadB
MARGPDRDPERERIDELARRVREGAATEAEREELALYSEERQEVAEVVTRADADRRLGGQWLARVEADRRIEAAERTPFVIAERAVGMTLAVAGVVGALFLPVLGVATFAGLGILGLSVFRVRARTAARDPYKDIEK